MPRGLKLLLQPASSGQRIIALSHHAEVVAIGYLLVALGVGQYSPVAHPFIDGTFPGALCLCESSLKIGVGDLEPPSKRGAA